MILSDWHKRKIMTLNDIRRENLINKAKEIPNDYDRAIFIINYFTSNLPKDIIAQIDEVKENEVVDFKYDYSYINASETPFARKQIPVKSPIGEGTTFSIGLHDRDVPGRPMIYPSVLALKLGTCKIFSHELARLFYSANIKCDIFETEYAVDCYDIFNGTDEDGNRINVNTIKPIHHIYNIITIDNKQYKVDIAGYLTAKDYNQFNPDGIKNPIDINKFILTEDLENNPFSEAKANSIS